jgi:hypothetical protein
VGLSRRPTRHELLASDGGIVGTRYPEASGRKIVKSIFAMVEAGWMGSRKQPNNRPGGISDNWIEKGVSNFSIS